jgi:hypothetical protein
MRFAVVLIPMWLVAACARPDYSAAWPDPLFITAGPQPGYGIKRVVDKVGSTTLLGDDGSICRTSVHRFVATKVGSWIDCNWTLPLEATEIPPEA